MLESASDPEVRVAAYRGLVSCLPAEPALAGVLEGVLDRGGVAYSPQGRKGRRGGGELDGRVTYSPQGRRGRGTKQPSYILNNASNNILLFDGKERRRCDATYTLLCYLTKLNLT